MDEEFEIFFKDLKEDVQKRILEFLGLECPEDGNYDTIPIATIPKPDPEA